MKSISHHRFERVKTQEAFPAFGQARQIEGFGAACAPPFTPACHLCVIFPA
jgi:hypothetical protein